MSKRRAWKSRDHVMSIPLDREGYSLRIYRKVWLDDSECIEIQKWVICPTGKATLFFPQQTLQIPMPIAFATLRTLGDCASHFRAAAICHLNGAPS